ncbi:hypothetical protein NMG60_11035105 [Bertholletia excelsa]
MALSICSKKFLLVLFLISAIPLAFLISLETAKPATHVYQYHSTGWFRECAKWDDLGRRFIVSFFEGGLGEIPVPDGHSPAIPLEEVPLVRDSDLAGNSSLGLVIDRPRNRLLVAIADVFGNRFSALAAYDLSTWQRLFLTQLSGSGDDKSFADDVAVDPEGNAYVTDTRGSKIWKVGRKGEFISTITSPLFTPKEWYKTFVTLNGIVYHPNGYLIVIHTFSGNLFKVEIQQGDQVKVIRVAGGSLTFGDGIELLSPTKLAVAGNPSRLVESSDDWETASVMGKFRGPMHRLTTAATVKDGKVYLNHMVGLGYPRRKHAIIEAVFS